MCLIGRESSSLRSDSSTPVTTATRTSCNPGCLVAGASHSGADLAMECAPNHSTWLAGRDTGQIPFDTEGKAARGLLPILSFAPPTMCSPFGTQPARSFSMNCARRGPLLRYRNEDLAAAGVHRTVSRVAGVLDGRPVLDDGTVLDVQNVLWCTGFRRDFSWIDLPILDDMGWPRAKRGVATDVAGLYFAGLIFQFSFASMLVGGARRDARHVARQIDRRSATIHS